MDWTEYSTPERALICKTFASAAERPLSDDEKSHLLVRLGDEAAFFLAAQEAMPNFPAPSDQKKELQKLHAAIRRLSAAIPEVHSSTWFSIWSRSEMPDESSRDILQYIYDGAHDHARITKHLGILDALLAGTGAALDDLGDRPSKKSGPNASAALGSFIVGIANLYYQITLKEPRSNYSPSKKMRAGPFLNCLEACVSPFDLSPLLGSQLVERKRKLGNMTDILLKKRRSGLGADP